MGQKDDLRRKRSKRKGQINHPSTDKYFPQSNKGELATAIIWECYTCEPVNPYQLSRKFGTNINSVQYQIEKLIKNNILGMKKWESIRSKWKKGSWKLKPRFREWFKEKIVEPWKNTMLDIASNTDALNFSFIVIDKIHGKEKTVDDLMKLGLTRECVEFGLYLFAPAVCQKFKDRRFYYRANKMLPILITENGKFDMENRAMVAKVSDFAKVSKKTRKGRSEFFVFVDIEGKEHYGPSGMIGSKLVGLPLDYAWVLYRGGCSTVKGCHTTLERPRCCEKCKSLRTAPSIVKEVKVNGRHTKFKQMPKERNSQDCLQRAHRFLIDASLVLDEGETRDLMIFLKCPLGKYGLDFVGGSFEPCPPLGSCG